MAGWSGTASTQLVHELNANWIQGLKSHTSAAHWQAYGAALAGVFEEYFADR